MVESRTAPPHEPLGIGERLRNAREAKGLSLRAMADLTRIRTVYLQALEDERFGQLPGAVYARGFLRAYAAALGLDADRLMDTYPGVFEPPGPALIGTAGVEIPIRPAAPRSRIRIVATYLAVFLGLALVAIGIIGYRQLQEFNQPVPPQAVAPEPSAPEPSPPTPAPSEPPPAPVEPLQAVPAPERPPEPSPPPIATPEPPPAAPDTPPQPAVIDGVNVEVRTQGTSWLRVTADGERIFQGLLHEGETRVWQARRRLTIRVGNSPAVQVTVNGRRVAGPARKRVWEQTFTK